MEESWRRILLNLFLIHYWYCAINVRVPCLFVPPSGKYLFAKDDVVVTCKLYYQWQLNMPTSGPDYYSAQRSEDMQLPNEIVVPELLNEMQLVIPRAFRVNQKLIVSEKKWPIVQDFLLRTWTPTRFAYHHSFAINHKWTSMSVKSSVGFCSRVRRRLIKVSHLMFNAVVRGLMLQLST